MASRPSFVVTVSYDGDSFRAGYRPNFVCRALRPNTYRLTDRDLQTQRNVDPARIYDRCPHKLANGHAPASSRQLLPWSYRQPDLKAAPENSAVRRVAAAPTVSVRRPRSSWWLSVISCSRRLDKFSHFLRERLTHGAARNSIHQLAQVRRRFIATPRYVHIRAQQEHRLVVKLAQMWGSSSCKTFRGAPIARNAASNSLMSPPPPKWTRVYQLPTTSCSGRPSLSHMCGARAPGRVLGV